MKRLSTVRVALAVGLVCAIVLVGPQTLRATGTLTSQLSLKLTATGTQAAGLGTSDDPIALDWTQSFASGTGANQASNIFHDRRTLTASSSENLDLAGVLANKFGVTLTFTKIKLIAIRAASANTNNVLVGGAASNAFVNWVGDPTDIITVRPGGVFVLMAPDATAYGVTASTGDILKVANSAGTTSVTYDIVVEGID